MKFTLPSWFPIVGAASQVAYQTVNTRSNAETPAHIAFINTHDEKIRYVEACMAYMYSIRNARSSNCVFVASCTFYSAITGRSATGSVARMMQALSDELTSDLPFWQSGNGWIDVCDQLYSNINRVKKSVLGNKIVCVFNHVLAHAFYTKVGIEVDSKLFKRFESQKLRPTVWECATFADAAVGLLLFLAKAGRQAMLTGSVEAFFVDDVVVSRWMDEASTLRKDAEFLSNPKAIGITLASYIGKLDACIETGNQLVKIFKAGTQHTIIHSVLLELNLVKNRHRVTLACASFRRAPVGVFLYGSAGVAKTFLAAGLFNHYCSVRGIPKEDAVCWPRDDNDPFYSGYKSHFAGVLYDDAAKFRSNKVQGVDPSIKDIISAINNVPFVTNQGELCDKGKIPFLAEWVGVTSNLGDLNADQYYNCSGAFLRRLQVRITPTVKAEFRVDGEDKIDPELMPEDEQYPDLWDFDVAKPVITGGKGEFVSVAKFTHYAELLDYMRVLYDKHIANQDKLMQTVSKIGPEVLCESCKLPMSICGCDPDKDSTMLFGTAPATPQALLEYTPEGTPSKEMRDWIKQYIMLKRKLKSELCNTDSERLYYRQIWEEPSVTSFLAPDYDHDPSHFVELEKDVRKLMKEYTAMSPRDKIDMLTEDMFTRALEKDGDDYLDFEPRRNEPCFFIQEQLAKLRTNVLQFVPQKLSPSEMVLLDDFLYHKAPVCVGEGWPVADIVKAAICYINFYSEKVEDPNKFVARELLMADKDKVLSSSSFAAWFACQYFEKQWFHSTCNYLAGYSIVKWGFGKMARRAVSKGARGTLTTAAKSYDLALGGGNTFIVLIVAVCASGVLVAIAVKVAATMFPKKEVKKTTAVSRPLCPTTNLPFEYCGDCDHAVPQMDLFAVGKKPVVREAEKANVWTVTERNITKLDVDPRRPQGFDQAVSAVKNNLLYAESYGMRPGGMGKGASRILAIDSHTLLCNNHFLVTPCVLTIWFGPHTSDGVQPSVKVDVTEDMVERHPTRDLCFLKTMGLPVLFKDISRLFPKRSYQSVGPSFYVKKNEDGEISVMSCAGVRKCHLHGMEGNEEVNMQAWSCIPEVPTTYGDCGSLLFVQSPLGCVIVGLHCGYSNGLNLAYATPVYHDDFVFTRSPTVGALRPYGVVAQVRTSFVDLMPHDKLFTDFHPEGHLMVHGQLKGFRPRMKFTGRHTPFAHHVLSRGQAFVPPITDRMAAPIAHPWKQAQMVLANYLSPTHSISEKTLGACLDALTQHVSQGLTDEDWSDIHPVPLSVAVNGFPGVPNIDSQKVTTSGGHGFRGPKLQFLSEPEEFEEWSSYRKYDDVVESEVDRIMEDACEGIRPHAIYTASGKDEMLSKAKVEAGKARVIYMCPVDFLSAMRMMTLGLTRVMVRRRDLFGIAVGLNTHSEEWNLLFELASKLPGDNWVAGDFQAFESVLSILISNHASKFFVELCRRSGLFTTELLLALETLLADTVNPTIDFFGTLITLLGGEASGHQLTTFFNCICNQLLHMYAFVRIRCPNGTKQEQFECALEFFDLVMRNTLGDDVYLKVHPDVPEYNHTSIQKEFASIGIKYTMADKLAASVPYISWREVSFLKRKFVEHSAFPGVKVAALDRESIYKMMLYTIPSKSTSPEEQFASALASAQAEAFFHDRQFFDQIWELIESIPKSAELLARMAEQPRPTWGTMVKRFINASPRLQAQLLVPGVSAETTETKGSYCLDKSFVLQASWRVDPWGSTTMECSSEERIYAGVRLSPKKARKQGRIESSALADNTTFSKQQKETNSNTDVGTKEMTLPAVQKVIKQLYTEKRRKNKQIRWKDRVVAQSAEVADVSVPSTGSGSIDNVQETTVFKNEPAGVHVDLAHRVNRSRDKLSMTQDIGTYLERPMLIASYTWPENAADGLKNTFTPWSLFFGSTNVLNKLKGFSLLSANLHLKFLVNGSPFYYGALMASYTPLSGHRTDTSSTVSNLALVANSQKPHVWLNNQSVSTAEMTLPFLYPYPMMDIRVMENLRGMGKIELWQFAPLLSANGTSSSNVDIQVYAWADEVHVGGPTDRPIAQSKVISGPASTVASVASKLTTIPVLGPYASAAEAAARTVGGLASYLGFTNRPVLDDVKPVKQVPFQLASAEIGEPVMKLGLQPKQEISVGSVPYGGPQKDELMLKDFAGRTSFVVGSDWATTAAPGEILFTSLVNPAMFQRSSTQIAHTPMSWIAEHFQYWRGSIKFTFKVVRSQYHRGRLQIAWDRGTSDMAAGAPLGNNNTLTAIMDLDESDEVCFEVPYSQARQFLDTYAVQNTGTEVWSTSATPSGVWDVGNGIINVRVMNRLTAPEASSSVRLLVFVSAGEDMKWAAPRRFPREIVDDTTTGILSLSPLLAATAQSSVVYDDEAMEKASLGDCGPDDSVLMEVFGENIVSLRELLHRSSLAKSVPFYTSPVAEGNAYLRIPFKRMPPAPGIYPNGWDRATTTSGANQYAFYSPMHPLVSISSCFIGYKGSVNVAINATQLSNVPYVDSMNVCRIPNASTLIAAQRRPSADVAPWGSQSGYWNWAFGVSGAEGEALTNTRTNTGLVVNLPYYVPSGFLICDSLKEYSNQDTFSQSDKDWFEFTAQFPKLGASTTAFGQFVADMYYGSGPDFDLVFFINVPVLNYLNVTVV